MKKLTINLAPIDLDPKMGGGGIIRMKPHENAKNAIRTWGGTLRRNFATNCQMLKYLAKTHNKLDMDKNT